MRVWYFLENLDLHERFLYRHRALSKVFERFSVHTMENLPKGQVDAAFVCGHRMSGALQRTGIGRRARNLFYITGGGWRRPDTVRRSLAALKDFDYRAVILTNPVHLDKYRKVHNRVFYVDHGFAPEIFYPSNEKTGGIVFVGNPAMGRERRLQLLAGEFPGKVAWKQGLSHARMADFLRSGLIGWNQIARGGNISCNLRVWETLGCRIMLLCNRSKHVANRLKDGEHCVFWDDDKDLVEKAGYYLAHHDEREYIAKQGYEEALTKHTWHHRALEYKRIVKKSS